MDNCSIHKAKAVREFCQINNIPLVFNIPYCPEYNGIEALWGVWKFQFRKQLLDLNLKGDQFKVQEIIEEI